jgi:hypothetical protein
MDHSLNGWISEKEQVFDEKLLGSWVAHDPDEKTTFVFKKQNSGYRVDWIEERLKTKEIERSSYDAMLGRIGGKLYLDYIPVLPSACADSTGVLLTHGLARIDVSGDSFTISLVNSGRLEDAAKHNQLKDLRFAWQYDNDLLLTSPTSDLAAYLLAHGQEEDFFAEPSDPLVRQK